MNTQFTPTSDRNTIPFPPLRPDAVEPPAGAARRGRPSGYSEKVVEMICVPIRQSGLSDSAAAESVGMSSSSISRWKRQFPELAPKLKQAREDCRKHYLGIIERHAESDTNRGLRAAMWMLERVFPGDYARRMDDRFEFQTLEDRRREREERAVDEEIAAERLAAQKAQAEQARKDWDEVQEMEAEAAKQAAASEGDSHNVKNSGEAGSTREVEHSFKEPGRPRPEDLPDTGERNSGPGRAESLNEAQRVEESTIFSERDSHNVKNTGESEAALRAFNPFTASESDSHNVKNSPPGELHAISAAGRPSVS